MTYSATVITGNNVALMTKEHCLVNKEDITSIGRDLNQQVRLVRSSTQRAIYTVKGTSLSNGNVKMIASGWARLGGGVTETVTVDAQITKSNLTDVEAKAESEFVERLTDDGQNQSLIAIAPHGGMIEPITDTQAEHVGQQFPSTYASVWLCRGYKSKGEPAGEAKERWHITATDISEESFPELKKVIKRGFLYAVAFHGWTENLICVGGGASSELKVLIQNAIQAVLLNSGITVITSDSNLCPPSFNGDDPKNLVNRLATNGIQIEQSMAARETYGNEIADAVAGVLGPQSQRTIPGLWLAIDPMASILLGEAYLHWVELHHPHVPTVREIQVVLRTMTPEEQNVVLSRARTLAAYGKVFDEAISAIRISDQRKI